MIALPLAFQCTSPFRNRTCFSEPVRSFYFDARRLAADGDVFDNGLKQAVSMRAPLSWREPDGWSCIRLNFNARPSLMEGGPIIYRDMFQCSRF